MAGDNTNVIRIIMELENRLTAGLEQASGQLRGLGTEATRMGKQLSEAGSVLMRSGATMTLATAPLAALGVAGIKAASDTAESASKASVVFGRYAETVATFADTAAKAAGLSSQAATEAAGTFGNLLMTTGLGQKAAAGMSTSLVQLGADLASFNNIPTGDALEKLRSGLTGESEPLKAFGILLTETAVAAKAVQMGLASSTTSVSEAAKVQARYALMMEQSGSAQGDFAKTSNGLANSLKTSKAEIDNATAALGKSLIPFATAAAREVGALANAFTALPEPTQNAAVAIAAIAVAAGPAVTAVGALAKIVGTLATAWGALGVLGQGMLTGAAAGGALVIGGLKGAQAIDTAQGVIGTKQAGLSKEDENKLTGLWNQYTDAESMYMQALQWGNEATAASFKAQSVQLRAAYDELRGTASVVAPAQASMLGLGAVFSQTGAAAASIGTAAAGSVAGVDALTGAVTTLTAAERFKAAGRDVMGNAPGWFAAQLTAAQTASNQVFLDLSNEADKARLHSIQLGQTAAERAVTVIQEKFMQLSSAITSSIDGARQAAKGLFDVAGGGQNGIVTEAGKNGPFEAMYRMADLAATEAGRKPGSDTAKWAALYGPGLAKAGTSATEAATQFQAGNLLAPGVFENINWAKLGEQAAAGLQNAKISTYAGQATAGLMSAGQPLTADNLRVAIDSLAGQDKGGMIPSLTNINAAIAAAGGTSHTDFGNTIGAINAVTSAISGKGVTVTAPAAANQAPHITVTISDGAVKIGGDADASGRGKSFGELVAATLKALALAESRQSVGAAVGLPGTR